MKIIDQYIFKKFLTTFFFIVGLFVVVAVVFDLAEKLDNFIQSEASVWQILFNYYLNFVIFIGNLIAPLLIFITVILFTSQMASRTEIIAILSSGVSFKRMLLPYFFAATALAFLFLITGHYLLPNANETRIEFENTHMGYFVGNFDRNIHVPLEEDEFVYFESYNVKKNTGYKFGYEKWQDGKLLIKMLGDYATWDSTESKWAIHGFQAREFLPDGKELLIKGEKLDTALAMLPEDFERVGADNLSSMNTPELLEFIEQERKEGSENIPSMEIELHQRSSVPFATYILTLLGVSIAARKTRGGTGVHLAMGIVLSFVYILLMRVSAVYATNAGLDALIAVWIPNVFFTVISVYFFIKAPK